MERQGRLERNRMKKENSVVEAIELTKTFGNITAVNHVSFAVRKREFFGFLGPNGAGKTTTIRMLIGLLTPDSGVVLIDGIDIRKNPIKAKMKMGVIPEMGNIYVDLTAKQNIILSGRFYGFPKKLLEKKADELLAQFGLYERKNDLVKNFSRGMKQRVNIASAIIHDPEILFLDEPTSGLDVQSQRLIKTIVNQMNEKGTTIFLTTHNIEEANQLCTRIAIIHKGEIAVIDSPEKLRSTFDTTQSVEMSFDKTFDDKLVEENDLVNRVEKMGDRWKLYTNNPDRLVKHLTKYAEEHGLTIISLEICRPSLEDAFVKFTKP